MAASISTTTWSTVQQLQDELAAEERRRPGGRRARQIEAAISRLVDGLHEDDDPAYARRNSLRRARFLDDQAAAQRPAAVVRAGTDPAALVKDGPHLRCPQHPQDAPSPDDVEQDVIALDLAARMTDAAQALHHGPAVLAVLLGGATAKDAAGPAGVSSRTAQRVARDLRAVLLTVAAA